MLNIMRKHAASFMIKIILGMIIVSFVFFYGWSKMQKVKKIGGASGDVVAKIDKQSIPSDEYTFFYEQTSEKLGKQFKVKDKSSLDEMVKSMAINQVIRRHLLLDMAKMAGFEVSNQELAGFIKKQFTNEDGYFDANFYLDRYLPYFKNRYGIDYETLAKQDITISLFENNFNFLNNPVNLLNNKEKEWTFAVVEFDGLTGEKGSGNSIEKMKEFAQKIISEKNIKNWEKLSKKYNAVYKPDVKVRLSDRTSLFNFDVDDEAYKTVFSLDKKGSSIDNPLVINNKVFVVALMDIKDVNMKPESKPFIDSWLESRVVNAKIKTFIK